jgi:cellulose synthase/poly-beta-1,6-N-acetylglucosamine synthase-like glycosyltransferase
VTAVLARALNDVDWFVLVYFFAINSSYLLLVLLAAGGIAKHRARRSTLSYEDSFVNPLAPSVSVILPTYNEEAVIATSVAAALSLRYAELEVIVVLDGPTDDTFGTLQRAFDLVEVPCQFPRPLATRAAPLAKFVPRGDAPLVVITKENSGRADSGNVGINSARYPLICMVDADSILDPEALLRVAQPFLDDPERVVATGGVIRAVNGCRVRYGRVLEARMPSSWLARIQVSEYLLAFLLGRTGWSRLGSLLIISGAFGLFRRDIVLAVGGLDATCIGEDAELVVRIHRWCREQHRAYRIEFVAEPVSWTEVPESLAVLARQRRRWGRGLAEVMWRHRRLIGNPRYGRVGMLALPYYVVFELFAPVVQLIGAAAVVLALVLGTLGWGYGGLFFAVAVGYGLVLSTAALAIEELTFHRYRRWGDLVAVLTAAALQNIGYRQLTALWQLQGMWAAICGRKARWGVMARTGFILDEVLDSATVPR